MTAERLRCAMCGRPVTAPSKTKRSTAVWANGTWNHRACMDAAVLRRRESTTAEEAAYREGAAGERAAVVAWLRGHEGPWDPHRLAADLEHGHGMAW